MANRLLSVLIPSALALLLAGIAFWASGQASLDWRYQLAGLADPFLGRPAPGASIIAGAVVTCVALATWGFIKWTRRSASRPGGTIGRRWWWVLAAWWIGYLAGSGVTIVTDSPVTYAASVHVEFRTPAVSVADAQGTCRSVVGQPGLVAVVGGFLQIDLRDPLGRPLPPSGRASAAVDHRLTATLDPGSEIRPANLPDRSAPYRLRLVGYPGTMQADPPLAFMQVYDYLVTQVSESGLSGVAELTAVRWPDPGPNPKLRWVNLTIPNDPWPPTYELTLRWTCGAST